MPRLQASVTATTTHVVKLSPALKKRLLAKLHKYAELKAVRDDLNIKLNGKRDKKTKAILIPGLSTEVEEIMEELDEPKLAVEGFKTTIIAPVKKGKFNPKKAVAMGIPMEKILQCYDEDEPGTSYVKISVPGARDEDDD